MSLDYLAIDQAIATALQPGVFVVVLVADDADGELARSYIRNRYRGSSLEIRIKTGAMVVEIDADEARFK